MCGIAGLVARERVERPERLLRMRDAMTHRGPDDAGEWWSKDGRVGLAHRRLSIIDLSPAGHQPMQDESGQITLTFNGEIYNFHDLREALLREGCRFRSTSDTEVLIQAYACWGLDFLDRIDGMFAFALHDARKNKLFLARDRAGEKPLFYTGKTEGVASGGIAFASELKGLMTDPRLTRRIDAEALDHYLAFGYVPGSLCILEGVRKLPAAHVLSYDMTSGQVELHRYWQLPEAAPDIETADENALVEELEGLLEESVRQRLVADVPVGVLLSGGVDSSLVTALAARVSKRPVRTFTIAFPGAGRFDEAHHARKVADHFGTEHVELPVEDMSSDLLPELARQFDEPVADSSMIPTFIVSRLVRQHCTVALGGDAGDELFGGYRHYSWLQQMAPWRERIPAPLRALGAGLAARGPLGIKGRTYALGMGGSAATANAHVDMYFDRRARQRLLRPELRRLLDSHHAPEDFKHRLYDSKRSLLRNATAIDFQCYLPEDILAKVDRASMLTSLEVRAPWLDRRIIEFAFSRVPDRLRATQEERKILPRRLAQRILPESLDIDRKQGFSVPLDSWLAGQMGARFETLLKDAPDGLFEPRALDALWRMQRRGLSNGKRLFALGLLELWRRSYDVALPQAPAARPLAEPVGQARVLESSSV